MSKRYAFMKFVPILITLFSLSIMLAACSSKGGSAPPTYSLSGNVSGDITQGVTIAVSGAMSASVLTDADGNYSVSGLPNGSYTIIPSKAGYTFNQASKSVVISGADSSGNDFSATAVPYTITGSVNGAVQAGVTITVTGTTEGGASFGPVQATTSGDGSYSVADVPNGSYTVTPTKAGYSFDPVSRAVTISAGNGSASFTSAVDSSVKFNLTGTVSGDIKAGVTINVTGTASGSASTDADGDYTVPNLPNGTYTVSASRPGYTFGSDLPVTIDGADSSGNNFTATAVLYSISGTVSGDVTAGVTITVDGTTEGGASFGPVEMTTAGDGAYSVPDVPNGDYTVMAALPGYSFNPASYAVDIDAGNSTGRNFSTAIAGFNANGGAGTAGSGGNGGAFYAESYGSIQVLNSGTVNASFPDPGITPEFGIVHFTVSAGTTTVPLDQDTVSGGVYAKMWDAYLYLGDGDGDVENDSAVTGLTIPVGSTLVLADTGFSYLQLDNDLVVNGILTIDLAATSGFQVEANLIFVETTGKITASATTGSDNSGGEIYLGYGDGLTKTIINRGTIEAKGDGSGYGGYIYFEPDDLVVNYGTIDVSGGNNGGSGGEFDAFVDYGDFYSSGTVRMNGGSGETGGSTEYDSYNWNGYSCWIETAYLGNANGRNGDIIISGTWEAKGGDGSNGDGGTGGYLSFQTDGMGMVKVNASVSVKGGNGTGAGFSGGSAGYIDFVSYLDPWGNGGYNDPDPGTISIGGTYDLRGGNGNQDGGSGGYLYVYSDLNFSDIGSDVEFVGVPVITMNGGEGGENGGSASQDDTFRLYSYASLTNQADIQAKGGNATLEGATGGTGGYVYMQTDLVMVLTNSGHIDVSGGDGDTGGSAFGAGFSDAISLQGQHVVNSGNLTANGGNGGNGTFDAGGDGGNITLMSSDEMTENTGTLSVAGGAGATPGQEGTGTIDGNIVVGSGGVE